MQHPEETHHRGAPVSAVATARHSMRVPSTRLAALLATCTLAAVTALAQGGEEGMPRTAAEEIVAATTDPSLHRLLGEVLDRNPELARLAAQARAAEQLAPQVRSLPDPVATLTLYLQSPETRVGPQQAMASVAQRFPWFGKLALKEKAAVHGAVAARARLGARRLELITEATRLAYEVAFLDAHAGVIALDRQALGHYEELARARYASGVGLDQAVLKIQAEITKDDSRLLDINRRRAAVAASLNALRDSPQDAPVPSLGLPVPRGIELDLATLAGQATGRRPELAAAAAEIERAEVQLELARKEFSPDVTVGLTYALVGRRDDPAGRANPPPDDGQDVLGVSAGINLPIWRERLAAGVAEAVQHRLAAEEAARIATTAITAGLGDLTARIPLIWKQIRLFEDVLLIQAEHSRRSAESAYAAGTAGALDLLDAERVLLDVQVALERARADHAIAIATLQGAVAAPLEVITSRMGEDR